MARRLTGDFEITGGLRIKGDLVTEGSHIALDTFSMTGFTLNPDAGEPMQIGPGETRFEVNPEYGEVSEIIPNEEIINDQNRAFLIGLIAVLERNPDLAVLFRKALAVGVPA